MNKKLSTRFVLSKEKQMAVYRLCFILDKLNKQFGFQNISASFAQLQLTKKKYLHKFKVIEAIKRRKIEEAFMALNSIPKRMGNKEKYLLYLKNLSISLVVNFLCKGHSKNKFDAFSKIKNIKLHTKSTEIGPLMLGVSLLLDNLRKRIFMNQFFGRLKNISRSYKKMEQFFKKLNLLVNQTRQFHLFYSFSQILKEAFQKTHLNNLEAKEENIKRDKSFQIQKKQQLRLLKTEIVCLTKALQLEQVSKNKNKREDYQRNLIIQAKNKQKQKSSLELKRNTFENENLSYDLSKKEEYLKIRWESRSYAQSSQLSLRKTYGFVVNEKTKENLSLKQMTIFLQRNSIDLIKKLKKFEQSKQNITNQNIDLKNMVNLYEKDISGFGVQVNIKESQTYKRTMEQNVNLREVLECLLQTIIVTQDKSIQIKNEELNKQIESHNHSQKGSKITLTTLSSSTNGTAY